MTDHPMAQPWSVWHPIETAPPAKKLIVYGPVPGFHYAHVALACFYPQHTLAVAEGYEGEDWVETDLAGECYMPAGWYEETHAEDAPAVNLSPTHWMPLPPPPSTDQ